MTDHEPLVPKHGGYRRLKTFQLAQLVYDVTVQFCGRYVDRKSRTHDQMVQAARSGVQNIAEGSQASGTSKKTELKLTNVARASLEELRLDFEDFLRQRNIAAWEPDHPALVRFRGRRCSTLDDIRAWVREERRRNTDEHRRTRTDTDRKSKTAPGADKNVNSCVKSSVLVANAALSLLNLCCHLLDRQLAAQSEAFLQDGGFTERLYRRRRETRDQDG